MINKNDFKNMSNEEIKIEMKKLENDYEATKSKALALVKKMEELDVLYVSAKNELNNRNKGIF